MSEGGFLDQKPRSPTGLVIVVAMHAVVITALAVSKLDVPIIDRAGPLEVRNILIPPDPEPIPPEPKPQPNAEPQQRSVVTRPDRVVDVPVPPRPDFSTSKEPVDLSWRPVRPGPVDVLPQPSEPKPMPTPEPVRTAAVMLPSSELLPPYPAAEERAEREGSVTVRLLIGADGRVKTVEKVSAANEAFWRATGRHALRNWRFKPATEDGRPVESRKTLTVKFELQG